MGPEFKLDDIVNYKGNICAVNHGGQALLISGVNGMVIKELSKSLSKSDAGDKRKLLVVYDGEVYLIVRRIYKFWVFKMNEELQKWERIYDLGEKVLFVSYDKCFFVKACDLSGIKGNCIFFPKNCFPTQFGDTSVDDELFQPPLENYLVVAVFYMDRDNSKLVSSDEECDIFWLPPVGLNPDIWKSTSSDFSEEDEDIDSANNNGSESSSKDHSSAFIKHGDDGQGAENPPSTSNQKDTHVDDVEGY
ncbi:F-box protein At4g35733-like [Chenopodium quinoa]|uniref:F-box protein At4g35733-like n=1 Tax=Chenopodium quinoa TaxID=63459 RepID=UPI000B772F3F|nr:F-box protein At4g35733-like [Chenopodium quinoa]